jgi:quercetin dioxygenase-like cupin family protein
MNKTLLINRDGLKVIQINLAKGETLPEHMADADVIVTVVKGRGVFTIKGIAKAITQGDVIDMLPNVLHAVEAQDALEIVVVQMQLAQSSA